MISLTKARARPRGPARHPNPAEQGVEDVGELRVPVERCVACAGSRAALRDNKQQRSKGRADQTSGKLKQASGKLSDAGHNLKDAFSL